MKAHLDYDRHKGEIIGLEDNGRVKSTKLAKSVFAILARGICEKWEYPLDYLFVPSCALASEVKRVVFEAVRGLREIGFHPIVLISDMGSNFQALASLLEVNAENTTFMVDEEKLYYMFDTPHLLKLIRNNLFKYDIIFEENKRASFKDIETFYQMDTKKEFRLAPKLSKKHLYPSSRQKMSVKLAGQVLSHSTAAGIYTLVAGNKLSATAISTAEFIEFFDKLFDIFNSSTPNDVKKMRRAFTGSAEQIEFLHYARNFIRSMKFLDPRGGKNVTNRIMCVKGWLINITSLLGIWDSLIGIGFKFLCSRKLNSDKIEHFWGAAKRIGGCQDLTPLQFSHSYRNLREMKFLEIA